jgi:RNA polymerase sigma factor (sigma-70 family)
MPIPRDAGDPTCVRFAELGAAATNQSLARVPTSAWSDGLLIDACRAGDERAWTVLVNKYRPLILSVPRRYGATPEDAADVFQTVCIELFRALPRLRKAESVKSWLMRVASHEASRWKQARYRKLLREVDGMDAIVDTFATPSRLVDGQELAASIRHAVGRLPDRQQQLVQMLFFHDPPLKYDTVASRLGLTTGSVGFIRARCLKKLRDILSAPVVPAAQMTT